MARKTFCLAFVLAALMTAALILGGCGEKSQDPQEALSAAAQAARDAGTVHAQMSVALSPLEGEAGMGLNIQGDAWIDMDAGVMEARFTVMGMELNLRYVDGTAYLQFGGKWYEVTGEVIDGIGEETIDAAVNVLTSLPEIISSNLELKELGDKKVGDYDCTNLEIVPDLQAISAMDSVQKLADELGMTAEELEDYLAGADVVIEVCIQKDEPIIREAFLAASMELPSISDVMGIPLLPEKARIEITIDFPEYGVEVDVQAPADAAPFEGL